jgi:hypothetical protein
MAEMNNPADEISQAEKLRILAEDRRASTYFHQAQSSLDDLSGGRYGPVTKSQVVGASPVAYPRLPSDAPSNQMAMMPEEPPLGYRIDDQEPTGQPHELAKSLQASSTLGTGVDGVAPTSTSAGDAGGVGAQPKFRRRV